MSAHVHMAAVDKNISAMYRGVTSQMVVNMEFRQYCQVAKLDNKVSRPLKLSSWSYLIAETTEAVTDDSSASWRHGSSSCCNLRIVMYRHHYVTSTYSTRDAAVATRCISEQQVSCCSSCCCV